MKKILATALLFGFIADSAVQAQQFNIGGDINSIPPQHRNEFLQQQGGGVGIPERMDANGNIQRFINGRFQAVNRNQGIGGDINSISPQHRDEYRRKQRTGLGIPERMDANGNIQRFINGRFQAVNRNQGIGGDINSISPQHRDEYLRRKHQQQWGMSASGIHGLWKCSCGGTWDLSQRGAEVAGSEAAHDGVHSVRGTFSGNQFRFVFSRQDGQTGQGMLVLNAAGNQGSGRIRWSNGRTTSMNLVRMP